MQPQTYIWAGDHRFDTLQEAVDFLNEARVGRVEYWLRGRITGIETPTCHVNLYRGNKDAEIVSALLPDEQVFVEEGLLAQFEDSNDASD